MNNLAIKTNNFYIIFYDSSHIIVTESQYEKVLNTIDNNESFEINGNLYKSNSISKVLSEKQYNEEYPEKKVVHDRIQPNRGNYVNAYPVFEWTKLDSIKALKELIRGLKQFISGCNHKPVRVIELKEQMEKKLILLKNN